MKRAFVLFSLCFLGCGEVTNIPKKPPVKQEAQERKQETYVAVEPKQEKLYVEVYDNADLIQKAKDLSFRCWSDGFQNKFFIKMRKWSGGDGKKLYDAMKIFVRCQQVEGRWFYGLGADLRREIESAP